MDLIKFKTNLLFYKIYKNIASGSDYLNWGFSLLENDVESESLFKLSSMSKADSLFIFEDFFYKLLEEMGLKRPTDEETVEAHIILMCQEIINQKSDLLKIASDIFREVVELHYPDDLVVWLEINDAIDRVIYDNEGEKQNEDALRKRIIYEAKKYLSIQEAEDII
ncbi:hypothetical protein [Paenibacillus wulumuqiensis]|uniref:hypothetical protein n=1 Tax=Paenibacillus wulumuqiensis TaxID=1567107 RepID=UPI0006199EFA|nr:hypothetical protein [Paenibacillus wulumuqiensis]